MSTLEKKIEELGHTVEGFIEKHLGQQAELQHQVDNIEMRANREKIFGGASDDYLARERAARELAAMRQGKSLDEAHGDLEQLEDYQHGFRAYLRAPNTDQLSPSVKAELQIGSDPAGGFFVDPMVSSRILQRTFESSPVRQLATTEVTNSDALEFPDDPNEADGGWGDETESVSESATPQVGRKRIPVHILRSMPSATLNMLEDGSFDVADWLIRKTGDKFGRLEAGAFVSGNGVGRPRGILSYSSDAVTTDDDTRDWGKLQYVPTGASGGFPTLSGSALADDADPLYDVVSKLKAVYRPNARWAMNRATANVVSKLRDGDGRKLWTDSLRAGEPNTLLGFPVDYWEDLPDVGADSDSILFGDFRAGYTIVDRTGMTVLRDPFTKKGSVRFYMRRRVGGDVVDYDAIKILRFSAS